MQNHSELLENLECVVLEPKQTAKRSVIWLHGLGADGHDFAPIVPQLNIHDKLSIRFVLPHSPSRPVTVNNGFVMPAWFDIFGIDKGVQEDTDTIPVAREAINNLIEKEHASGIPYENIMLVGFSMGAALALYSGLKFPHKLAGVIGLSGYLFRFDQEYSQQNKSIPIMLAHGSNDPIVLPQFGLNAKERLVEQGYNVSWNTYPMEHQVCIEEVLDIANFMKSVFV